MIYQLTVTQCMVERGLPNFLFEGLFKTVEGAKKRAEEVAKDYTIAPTVDLQWECSADGSLSSMWQLRGIYFGIRELEDHE